VSNFDEAISDPKGLRQLVATVLHFVETYYEQWGRFPSISEVMKQLIGGSV